MARIKKVSIMNSSPLGNPFAYNSGGSSSFGNRLPPEDNNARITANSNSRNNYSMGLGAFNRQSNVGMSMPSSGIKITKPKTTTSIPRSGSGQQSVGASGGSIFGGSYATKKRMEKSMMCKCGSGMSKSMCKCGAGRNKRMKKDFRGNYSMGNRSLSKAEMGLPTNFNIDDLKNVVNNLVGKTTPYAQRALDTTRRATRSFVGNAQGVARQIKDFATNEMMTGGIKPSGRSRIATNYEMALRGPKPAGASREPRAANRSAVINENIPVYTLSGVADRLKSFGKPTRRGQYDESNQLQRATQFVRDFGEYLSPTKGKNILPKSENPASRAVLRRINGVNTIVQQQLGRQKVKDGKLVNYDEYYKDWNLPKGPIKALTEYDVAGKKVNPRMQIWETGTMAPSKNSFETIIPQKETFTYDTKAKRYRSDSPTQVGSEISEYERKPKGRPAGVAPGYAIVLPKPPKGSATSSNSGGTLADYQYAQELLANAGYNLNNVPRKKVDKRMSKGLLSAKMPRMYPTAASNRSMMKSISSMYQDGTKHVVGGYRRNIGKRFAGPKQNKYMD